MTKATTTCTAREGQTDVSSQRFVSDYVAVLKERTRSEKQGIAYGLDWVVYNLGLAMGWQPVRLPFLRGPERDAAQTKTEPEFGIDLSFLADNGTSLQILVLKDEPLTYKNWIAHSFDTDLRRASAPDLSGPEFEQIRRVHIVLAYNKDEDATGIRSYKDLIALFPSEIKDGIALTTERWNLSKLSELVHEHLLKPELLPQNLSGLLSYICSQVADFRYGSEEWDRQLVPNWRRFLTDLDKGRDKKTALLLIPVALVILNQFKRKTPDAVIGWLDLMEWAMLWMWGESQQLDSESRRIVEKIWLEFFLVNYEDFLNENAPILNVEHGIQTHGFGSFLDAVNDSCVAFWLIERIGIFVMGSCEFLCNASEDKKGLLTRIIGNAHNWILGGVQLQPALLRPLIDLHHIGIFLIWYVLQTVNDKKSISIYLQALVDRLFLRRIGIKQTGIPFIEGGNRLELVGEAVATSEMPSEFVDTTSYLVLMLMDLCFSLDDEDRDALLDKLQNHVVEGRRRPSDGDPPDGVKRLVLQDWIPPTDWLDHVFKKQILQDGTAITNPYSKLLEMGERKPLTETIRTYVGNVREKHPTTPFDGVSIAAVILACVKNKSPLPSFLWRDIIF